MSTNVSTSQATIPRQVPIAWVASGLALLACCVAMAWLAQDFDHGSDMAGRPIPAYVILMMAAALVYFGTALLLRRATFSRPLAWWIFAVGAVMRLLMAASQPVLEDDFQRYLWDGALTAHGINPYAIRPADANAGADFVPEGVRQLAREGERVLARVNHPALGTIYPPVAEVVFALAHGLTPWHVAGLHVLYYAADCAIFALLLALLRQSNRPAILVMLYWWNPLIVKELYNSLHMDILVIPGVLGALLLAFRGRPALASCVLAVATATKLWPVLLMPPLLATLCQSPRKLLACVALFSMACALLLAPMAATRLLGDSSGLAAYGLRWEMNDALFMVFPWLIDQLAGLGGYTLTGASLHRGGKVVAACLVLLVVSLATRRVTRQHQPDGVGRHTLAESWLWITAALFLLSPTQFPWYFVWFAPLLVLVPNRGLLLLTLTMPLYYLKFYLEARGQVSLFHYGVVWLEYVPVWLLLLWDWGERALPRVPEQG